MMLNSELSTIVQEQAKIVIVVFDNAAFGCINNLQMGNGVVSIAGSREVLETRKRIDDHLAEARIY